MTSIRILALALAIFSISLYPELPSYTAIVLVGILALCSMYRRYWVLSCWLIGSVYGACYGHWVLHQQLPEAVDNQSFTIVGVVDGLPVRMANRQRFSVRLERIDLPSAVPSWPMLGERLQLSWYNSTVPVLPGQRWQLTVKLRRPRGLVNPAGFDYQVHLLRRDIVATGYVKASPENTLYTRECLSRVWVDCVRYSIRQRLLPQIHQPVHHLHTNPLTFDGSSSARALLLALAIGDRSALSDDQWQLLRDTGTIHLMAISGLHIGLAAAIGFYLGLLGVRLWQYGRPLSGTVYWLPACLSISAAFFYSLLAGMTLPTQRALIMVVVFYALPLCGRQPRPWWVFSSALLGVSLNDPLAVTATGFWLSFLAVAILLYTFSGVRKLPLYREPVDIIGDVDSAGANHHRFSLLSTRLWGWLRAQWVITLGLLIPGVWLLQGVSVSAPVANLIAIPWVSLLVVPLLLLSLGLLFIWPSGAEICLVLTDRLISYLLVMMRALNEQLPPFLPVALGEVSWIGLVFALLGVLWLLSPRGVPYRYLGVVCLLPLAPAAPVRPLLDITFLDVGQGTAVVVQTQQHTLVYDTGPAHSERFNSGTDIIAPLLRHRHLTAIDHLMVSHGDADHAGGVAGLLEAFTVREFSSGEPARLARQISGLAAHAIAPCRRGDQWQWDGVEFQVLWPPADQHKADFAGRKGNSNNRSCVLLIRQGERQFLLAGDIERDVEQQLLREGHITESIDGLLVAHHGSGSSSHTAWVNALHPRWAVISVGYHSRYGHPHRTVLERYHNIGAQVLSTAKHGSVHFRLSNTHQWSLTVRRHSHRRYWY